MALRNNFTRYSKLFEKYILLVFSDIWSSPYLTRDVQHDSSPEVTLEFARSNQLVHFFNSRNNREFIGKNRFSFDWHSQPIASHPAKIAEDEAVGGAYQWRTWQPS